MLTQVFETSDVTLNCFDFQYTCRWFTEEFYLCAHYVKCQTKNF